MKSVKYFFCILMINLTHCNLDAAYRPILKSSGFTALRCLPTNYMWRTNAQRPFSSKHAHLTQQEFHELMEDHCRTAVPDRHAPKLCFDTCLCKAHDALNKQPELLEGRDLKENTPLLFATKLQRYSLVSGLLARRAHINVKDKKENSPLKVALIKFVQSAAGQNSKKRPESVEAHHIALRLCVETIAQGRELLSTKEVIRSAGKLNSNADECAKELRDLYNEAHRKQR